MIPSHSKIKSLAIRDQLVTLGNKGLGVLVCRWDNISNNRLLLLEISLLQSLSVVNIF